MLRTGQWKYTEPDAETGEVVSSIYRSIVINTSRETMNMSDFPMDAGKYPIYPVSTLASHTDGVTVVALTMAS